jgi:hypothetical protein
MDETPTPRPDPESAPLPARRLSTHELEAVIRRAVELQSAAGGSDNGVAEPGVRRVGQELGLEPAHVRRAITDIRSSPVPETGLMAAVMGPGRVRAARTVRKPAAELGRYLERYMVEHECMQVQRRFRDRTRYLRDGSFAAGVQRFTRQFGTRDPRLDLKQLDVAVAFVDDDTAFVELSVDLESDRASYAAGGGIMGTMFSAPIVLFSLVTPAPDLLALTALPVLGGMVAAWRAGYRHSANQVQEKLESFLDRLEHGEVRLPTETTWADRVKKIRPPGV